MTLGIFMIFCRHSNVVYSRHNPHGIPKEQIHELFRKSAVLQKEILKEHFQLLLENLAILYYQERKQASDIVATNFWRPPKSFMATRARMISQIKITNLSTYNFRYQKKKRPTKDEQQSIHRKMSSHTGYLGT